MRFIALALLAATLAGCAFLSEEQDPTADWSAQRFYDTAKGHLDRGDYEQAIEYYEKLEVRYPFGPLAMQAQLDVVYAYYKFDEPASAIAAADRFIKLHPRHPNVDYAYYLKGLVRFTAMATPSSTEFVARDMAQHDPRDRAAGVPRVRRAGAAVSRKPLRRRRPPADALSQERPRRCTRSTVARYYARREAWLAAANRARYVVESYHRDSGRCPEALRSW